jgi:hypothetical protein
VSIPWSDLEGADLVDMCVHAWTTQSECCHDQKQTFLDLIRETKS